MNKLSLLCVTTSFDCSHIYTNIKMFSNQLISNVFNLNNLFLFFVAPVLYTANCARDASVSHVIYRPANLYESESSERGRAQ